MSGRPLGRNCRWTLLTAETRTRSWKRSAVYKKRLQVHDQRFDEMVVGSVSSKNSTLDSIRTKHMSAMIPWTVFGGVLRLGSAGQPLQQDSKHTAAVL